MADDADGTARRVPGPNAHQRGLEASLLEAEQRYRTIADFTYDWETWTGEDGSLKYVSPSCERITGYSAAEFLDDPDLLTRIVEPDDRQALREYLGPAACVEPGAGVRFRIRHRGGEVRWIEHYCQPVEDDQGQNLGCRASNRDITASVRAEEEARRLRDELTHVQRVAAVGELAATLAHELNQPLAGILSNAQAALRFLDGPAPDLIEVRAALEDVVEDEKRASAVIRRVRAFLKKEEEPRVAVDVNVALAEVITLLRGQMTGGRVDVDLRLHPQLPLVLGDRVELEQVLLNLLLNAIEALEDSERPGKLIVETFKEGEDIVFVTISDSGLGVPRDVASRMFEPFFTTKTDGLGMGLSISRSIVERHKGRLWCEEVEGGGTRLVVELPVDGTSLSE